LAPWFFFDRRKTTMLRLLIGLGALYAAFQIGKEVGRRETEVIPLPPPDRRRDNAN
jgi:hypothetical protein